MVANKYAFLQITRRRFLNEWEAFKKVISRRNIRRRITIPLTLSNLKLLRRITRTENILHRNFTRRQVAIQNRVASNIGISQSTFSVKVLNLFSRSRRKTNKRKSKHSAMQVQLHFSKLFLILKSGVNHTSRGSISTSTLPSIKLRKCSSKIITSILSFISGRLATKSNQIKQLIRNSRSASLQRTFKKSFTSFSHSTRNKTRDGLIRVRNIRALNGRFNTSITHAYSIVIGSKHITLNATGGGFLTASKQFRHGATSKSRSNTASNSTKHKSPHLSGWRQIISLIT